MSIRIQCSKNQKAIKHIARQILTGRRLNLVADLVFCHESQMNFCFHSWLCSCFSRIARYPKLLGREIEKYEDIRFTAISCIIFSPENYQDPLRTPKLEISLPTHAPIDSKLSQFVTRCNIRKFIVVESNQSFIGADIIR